MKNLRQILSEADRGKLRRARPALDIDLQAVKQGEQDHWLQFLGEVQQIERCHVKLIAAGGVGFAGRPILVRAEDKTSAEPTSPGCLQISRMRRHHHDF